jgi:hypothetical protein
MKEILEKIIALIEKTFKNSPDWTFEFGEDMDELKELIKALPDEEKLEDKLSGSEKGILRRNQ